MAKKILLYGGLYSWSVTQTIEAINEASSEEIALHINSDGGDVEYSYGIISALKGHAKKKTVYVDGKARSMAAFFLCYCDYAEGLDVSQYLLHRASYGDYVERNYMPDEMRQSLVETNKNLRAALEAKIDVVKFEQITKTTLDELFSMESRIDVTLNAQQALDVGLINKIVKITPEKRAELAANYGISAEATPSPKPEPQQQNTPNKTNTNMTIEKLKAEFPDVYAAAYNAGITAERDRVGAHLAFIEVDAKAVADGIRSGEALTMTQMAEFSMKAFNKASGAKLEAEAAPAIETPKTTTEAEAANKSIIAGVMNAARETNFLPKK